MKKLPKCQRILMICILLLFFISLFPVFLLPVHQEMSVEMYYRDADPSLLPQLFWGENGQLSADRCSDGIRDENINIVHFSLPQAPGDIRTLRIDPSNTENEYRITTISFLLNGEYIRRMNAEEISEKFLPVNASAELFEDMLIIRPTNADSGLFIDSDELQQTCREAAGRLRTLQIRQRFFASLALAIALLFLTAFAAPLKQYICSLFTKDENGRFDFFTLVATAVMAGALLVVAVIGLGSELGLHPDEWDVKACFDYGMTHLLPPDMRDPEVAGTYSGYGYTKLENYTWYFYLAGKIALPFKLLFYALQYYRVPNVLMFLALAVIFARNIKKRNWLMVALGICVQAWYIFSYTTADAMDFFLSFLAVYELAVEDSLLYRTVSSEKITFKTAGGFLLFGLLFGTICLGKPNYLAILALAFFVLLFRLIRQKDKRIRSVLWRSYLCIVGIFLLTVGFRASFDFIYYGLDKAAVKETMSIQYSDPDKNPATPIEEQCSTYHMMAKGKPLSYLFEENPKWFSMSYKSFCGLLQDTDTGSWYYLCMGFFYIVIFLSIGIAVFRQPDNFWGRLEFVTGTLLMVGGLIASVLNSYIIDSQAQGRYLLPAILIAGYLSSRVPQLFEKPWFKIVLCLAGIFSTGYFGLVGVPLFF